MKSCYSVRNKSWGFYFDWLCLAIVNVESNAATEWKRNIAIKWKSNVAIEWKSIAAIKWKSIAAIKWKSIVAMELKKGLSPLNE